MKPLYIALLFYSSVKENQALVREAKDAVAGLSRGDYRVLGFGEHSCALAFTCEDSANIIRESVARIRDETFHVLVFSVDTLVGGTLFKQAMDWLLEHRPHARAT